MPTSTSFFSPQDPIIFPLSAKRCNFWRYLSSFHNKKNKKRWNTKQCLWPAFCMKHFHRFLSGSLTCSCCWRARSICCRCFSICEAASFFCSSWAARSCSRKLISWVIIVESCRSFSARLSGVPKCAGKMYCKYEIDNSYEAIFTRKMAEWPTCLFQVSAWI